jgi:hypothetical protein
MCSTMVGDGRLNGRALGRQQQCSISCAEKTSQENDQRSCDVTQDHQPAPWEVACATALAAALPWPEAMAVASASACSKVAKLVEVGHRGWQQVRLPHVLMVGEAV